MNKQTVRPEWVKKLLEESAIRNGCRFMNPIGQNCGEKKKEGAYFCTYHYHFGIKVS